MSNTPRISILMPFYNAAETLPGALDDIAAQSLDDFELLAVDDGSSDGSAETVAARTRGDRRIRLLQPGRLGLVGALNYGLERAAAPLVARMDADDRMHPHRLERQWRFLRDHPELTVTGTRVRAFPDEAVQAGLREYLRWQNDCLSPQAIAEQIYVESPLVHPSWMFRRDTVRAAGGYRHGDFPEDYELLLRLHRAGARFGKVPEVLLEWREGERRLTRTDPRCARESFDRVRAAYLACDPRLDGGRPLAIWGAGRRTRRRVAHLLALLPHPPAAWVDIDPKKIGNLLGRARVPVVGPEWLAGRTPRPFVLGYVANHGARDWNAGYLERIGYRRGADYLMVG